MPLSGEGLAKVRPERGGRFPEVLTEDVTSASSSPKKQALRPSRRSSRRRRRGTCAFRAAAEMEPRYLTCLWRLCDPSVWRRKSACRLLLHRSAVRQHSSADADPRTVGRGARGGLFPDVTYYWSASVYARVMLLGGAIVLRRHSPLRRVLPSHAQSGGHEEVHAVCAAAALLLDVHRCSRHLLVLQEHADLGKDRALAHVLTQFATPSSVPDAPRGARESDGREVRSRTPQCR